MAFELEVLSKKFDRFGWERDADTPAQDRLLTDWMDALQDYPLDEVRAACKAAVIASPNKVPNEGHILAQINLSRKKAAADHIRSLPRPDGPERDHPVSDEDLEKRRAFAESLLGRFRANTNPVPE